MCKSCKLSSGGVLQRASQEVQVAEKYREKMAAVQHWMAKIGLPHEHRTKIRAYYSQVGYLAFSNGKKYARSCMSPFVLAHTDMSVSWPNAVSEIHVAIAACGRLFSDQVPEGT